MKLFAAIGRFAVRFRWLVLIGWLALVPIFTAAFPSLSSVAKTDNSAFLPANAPSQVAGLLGAPFQPTDKATAVLVAVRGDGPLTDADRLAVADADTAVARLGVVHKLLPPEPAPDGHAELVEATLNLPPFGGGPKAESAVTAIRAAVASVRLPAGLAVHLTGALPSAIDNQAATNRTQKLTEQLSLLFILALLLIVFRSLLAPIVTLFPAALSLGVSMPLIAEATKVGVQVSELVQILLIVLVLGAGTDYGLFLIFRMREEIRAGRTPRDAVIVAVTRVGESIAFSAMTVIAALVSLLLATFGLYKGLGPGLAIGVGVVLVANLTLLPALLAIFGRVVFWPTRPAAGAGKTGVWGALAARVVERPVVTLAAGITLFGGLALSMIAYTPAGFGSQSAPNGSDSAQGQAALTAHFSAAATNPTNVLLRFAAPVWDNPDVLVRAERAVSAAPVFRSVDGPLNPLGRPLSATELASLHARFGSPAGLQPFPAPAGVSLADYESYVATQRFISPDGRTVQLATTLAAGDPMGTPALQAVPRIRSDVTAIGHQLGAVQSGVAGAAPAIADVQSASARDLGRIIPVVLVVLALLLALVLRSLVAPLYLTVSVGLSYIASLGFAVLVFVVIGGQNGLNFVLPFFMFIFIMALGEDYNILVMSRIREEAHGLRLRQAVHRAVETTGTTVTSAGLILAGTFAVLTIAGNTQEREIGVGLAAGVLLDTFFVRTLLVPAVVVLMGRWNWWPSRLSRPGAESGADELPPVDERSPAAVG